MNLNKYIAQYYVVLLGVIGCQEPAIIINNDIAPNDFSVDIRKESELIDCTPFVPDYYLSHVCEKEKKINDFIALAEGDCASFIFFTDVHWGNNQKNSPAIINHVSYYTPVDDVVFGGDVITTSFDNPLDAIVLGKSFRESFDTLKCNMYYLYGNHDNNSDGHPDEADRHLTDEQVYNYLQQGMSDCSYGNYFNFYFDRDDSKTRFVCLDTGRYYYPQFRDATIETARYLIEALGSTPEGWRIVLLSHLWCNLNSDNPIRKPYFSSFMKRILRIADNYNNRSKGVFKNNDESIQYDFTQSNSTVVTCIGGHCHLDAVLYSDGGIPVILTTTDSGRTVNGELSTIGTIEEQAVSVFVFDFTNNAIEMIRIGRGDDMYVKMNTDNH